MKVLIAVVLAYAILVILVSPAAASVESTVPTKHAIRPPQSFAPVAALLFTAALVRFRSFQGMVAPHPVYLATSGSDVVDLTAARLC